MTKKETIKDGLVETFYENGQLESKSNYKDGKPDGLWEVFYFISNNNPFVLHGLIKTRKNYNNGKQDGLSEWFVENGQLWSRKNYKDGKRDGLWKRLVMMVT